MTYETILVEQGATTVITLHRPERRNAFSIKLVYEVAEACRIADEDETVRSVIITGSDRYFSAGADMTETINIKTAQDGLDYIKHWQVMIDQVDKMGKPVIAAIEGFCFTGGWEFAMLCDIRIAGEGASFALTSSKIGTVPGGGGTQRLPREVGIAKALEILYTGDPIDAQEAYRIGAINRLVPQGQALQEARALSAKLEKRAPIALRYDRQAVRTGMQMDLTSALEFERLLMNVTYSTEDKHEGISAFLEKREAVFKGR